MITHESAASDHYAEKAKHYDAFNEERSVVMNRQLETLFRQQNVQTVLDLTCGTGSQVFWLQRGGFDVVGYDINPEMIQVARQKAAKAQLNLTFETGDMRTTQAGAFDAVITIFNAVGHLTRADFATAMKNINANLKPGGLYVFDIFNLDYLMDGDNITKFTVDWLEPSGDYVARKIQYSTISHDGIMASYDIYHEQKGNEPPRITNAYQTLQVYRQEELEVMLAEAGFCVQHISEPDGKHFHPTTSERMLVVAQKEKAIA